MLGSAFIRSLAVVTVTAVVLVGCRAGEKDRFVRYEPGVYKGKNASKSLSSETLAALRGRVKDSVSPPGGGGGVRPSQIAVTDKPRPAAQGGMSIDLDALRQRSRLQAGSGL